MDKWDQKHKHLFAMQKSGKKWSSPSTIKWHLTSQGNVQIASLPFSCDGFHIKDIQRMCSNSWLQLLFSRVADQSPVKLLIKLELYMNHDVHSTLGIVPCKMAYRHKRFQKLQLRQQVQFPFNLQPFKASRDFGLLPGLDAFTVHHKSALYSHRCSPHWFEAQIQM